MGILDKCFDLYGPLSDSNKAALEAMLTQPDIRLWQKAQRIVISPTPLLTLGMAVGRVSAQRRLEIPDTFTVYRACRYAIEKRERFEARPIAYDIES